MMQKISPAALISLTEALTVIYWKKDELRTFIENSFDNIDKGRAFCATIDFTKTKYQICKDVVTRLSNRPQLYNQDLLNLIRNVCDMNDFSHLRRWEDGKEKEKGAKEKVRALRLQCQGYFDKIQDKEASEKHKNAFAEKMNLVTQSKKIKDDLKNEFNQILTENSQQARGYKFERFLNKLFDHFDLSPRSSFKITGEQIDGAFTHNGSDYLLEAKWQDLSVNRQDLYGFEGKIASKLKTTLGLFISFNGFSYDLLNHSSKSVILMDGQDLCQILEDRISLTDMIEIKRKEAATTGKSMHRIIC